jgi:hypothetical protein
MNFGCREAEVCRPDIRQSCRNRHISKNPIPVDLASNLWRKSVEKPDFVKRHL